MDGAQDAKANVYLDISDIDCFMRYSASLSTTTDIQAAGYPDQVSYVLDSTENVDLPGFSLVILEGSVEGLMDRDNAHDQLLEELI